ncbi:MAG: hypothetical protein IGNPGNKH_00495 [Sodalis sp. Ffu]|nr:MAG: hypothetical protein IGNPGNKH_00495 [Sodalis sp. Ffu]
MEYIKLLKFNLLINLERRIADKNQVEANQYLIEDTEHEKMATFYPIRYIYHQTNGLNDL